MSSSLISHSDDTTPIMVLKISDFIYLFCRNEFSLYLCPRKSIINIARYIRTTELYALCRGECISPLSIPIGLAILFGIEGREYFYYSPCPNDWRNILFNMPRPFYLFFRIFVIFLFEFNKVNACDIAIGITINSCRSYLASINICVL